MIGDRDRGGVGTHNFGRWCRPDGPTSNALPALKKDIFYCDGPQVPWHVDSVFHADGDYMSSEGHKVEGDGP